MTGRKTNRYRVYVQAVIDVDVDAEDPRHAKFVASQNFKFEMEEAGIAISKEYESRVIAVEPTKPK